MELKKILFNKTILYPACESGNIELVKYLISMDKIDVTAESIFFNLFFIQF